MPFLPESTDLEFAKRPISDFQPPPTPGLGPAPSVLDVAAAAERSSNLAGTLYDRLTSPKPSTPAVPGYDPLVSIPKGYEGFATKFVGAQSPEEMEWRRQRIDQELADRHTIAREGGWGVAASLAAGLTDPLSIASMAIPATAPTRLSMALRLAGINVGVTTAQELAMHQLTETRTAGESALNVGASAILGGLLGAAIGPHVPKADIAALRARFERGEPVGPSPNIIDDSAHVPPAPRSDAVAEASRLRGAAAPPEGRSVTGEVTAAPERKGLAEAAADLPEGQRGVFDQPGRSVRALTPEQRAIEGRFATQLEGDYEKAKTDYSALPDTKGGKVLSVDTARELSPDYLKDRTQSEAVHEPGSAFIKRLYAEDLAQPPKEGEEPTVLFTGGGTGAGKSTAIAKALGPEADRAQIVYDTNLNSFNSAVNKIDQARAAGKNVKIAYVSRDVVESLVEGALKRARRQEGEFGSGRTVPIEEHVNTHVNSNNVIRELAEHYKGDPNVEIQVIDNSRGPGKATTIPLEQLPVLDYNSVREKAVEALHSEFRAGRISEAVYRGFAGEHAATARPAELPAGAVGPGVGREPEPQRAERRPDVVSSAADVKADVATAPDVLPPADGTGLPMISSPTGESTVGAAAVGRGMTEMEGQTVARGARSLVAGPGRVAPGPRLLMSPFLRSRQLLENLTNVGEVLQKHEAGVAGAIPIERLLWRQEGVWQTGVDARAAQFKTYRERLTGEGSNEPKLSRSDFNTEIAYAMRRGDQHAIPEISQAAKDTRRLVFQPLYDRARKLGMLPEDANLFAESYVMRQYDAVKINANRVDWHNRLREHFVGQGVDPAEADMITHQATRNVLGSERGTMDWRIFADENGQPLIGQSGQLKARTLSVPDQVLEPYLNNDIDHLTHSYIRSMAPEVEMTERFGSRDLKDQIRDLKDEAAVQVQRKLVDGDNAGAVELSKRLDSDIRDISAIRDRLYGVFGQPKDPASFAVRAGRLLRQNNVLRLLGAATLAHIPDIANLITRYGLPQTLSAVGKLATSMEAITAARSEAHRLGAALDMAMNTISVLGDFGSHSQFPEQRIAAKITRAFTIATGETPFVTLVQNVASVMGQHEILNTAERLAAGQEVSKNLLIRMAQGGLDQPMLERIAAEHAANGREINGLKFGMSDTWKDQQAASAFESAILKDAHGMTLRPSVADTPLFMSNEVGKLLLQFKTFAFAAARTVINPLAQGLARGDPRAMAGLMTLATAGFTSYIAKQTAAGQPIEWDNPGRMALEVLDKSNLLGWTAEAIYPALWQFGFKDLSRWSDRDPIETLLGPSIGTVTSTLARQLPAKITGNQEDRGQQFTRSDLHFLRRTFGPGQNVWWFRRAVNDMEDHIGDSFDLPGKSNADRAAERAH